MQIPKDAVLDLIRQHGGEQAASQAAQELPDMVDHEQHAGMLQKYGVNPSELTQKLGGAGGGLGGLFGGGGQQQ